MNCSILQTVVYMYCASISSCCWCWTSIELLFGSQYCKHRPLQNLAPRFGLWNAGRCKRSECLMQKLMSQFKQKQYTKWISLNISPFIHHSHYLLFISIICPFTSLLLFLFNSIINHSLPLTTTQSLPLICLCLHSFQSDLFQHLRPLHPIILC